MATVPIEQLLYGIRQTESGGEKNPYTVVNSIGAVGAYQVMSENISSWTKEALGRAYTKAEFIADPAAQDKVAAFRLDRDQKQYSSWESAAAVWFSGQPNPNSSASDGGSTVREYVDDVKKAMDGWKPGMTVPVSSGIGGLGDLVTGGLTDVLKAIGVSISGIASGFTSLSGVAQMLMKLMLPSTWVRIICGVLGGIFLIIGIFVLGREARGEGKEAAE